MADEREQAGQQVRVPDEYAWARLVKLDGDDLELQYRHTLENLKLKGSESLLSHICVIPAKAGTQWLGGAYTNQ